MIEAWWHLKSLCTWEIYSEWIRISLSLHFMNITLREGVGEGKQQLVNPLSLEHVRWMDASLAGCGEK